MITLKIKTLLDTGDADPAEALQESCNVALMRTSYTLTRQTRRDSPQRNSGRSWLAGWVVDYLMRMAHEAMPRWAMDRIIIPWDGPRNLTLSNKRGPLPRARRATIGCRGQF